MDGLINQMQESFYSINVYQNQVVHLSIISINLAGWEEERERWRHFQDESRKWGNDARSSIN